MLAVSFAEFDMCFQSLIRFGSNMIFSLSAFGDSITLGGGTSSIGVSLVDVSTLGGCVTMENGLSMIAVLIIVRSLADLLVSFTLGAACTSCGGLVAPSCYFPGGCFVYCWDVVEKLIDFC